MTHNLFLLRTFIAYVSYASTIFLLNIFHLNCPYLIVSEILNLMGLYARLMTYDANYFFWVNILLRFIKSISDISLFFSGDIFFRFILLKSELFMFFIVDLNLLSHFFLRRFIFVKNCFVDLINFEFFLIIYFYNYCFYYYN